MLIHVQPLIAAHNISAVFPAGWWILCCCWGRGLWDLLPNNATDLTPFKAKMLLCFQGDRGSPLGQKKLHLKIRVCQISATPWQWEEILVQDRWYLLKYVLTFSCQEILPPLVLMTGKNLPLLNAFQGSRSLLGFEINGWAEFLHT